MAAPSGSIDSSLMLLQWMRCPQAQPSPQRSSVAVARQNEIRPEAASSTFLVTSALREPFRSLLNAIVRPCAAFSLISFLSLAAHVTGYTSAYFFHLPSSLFVATSRATRTWSFQLCASPPALLLNDRTRRWQPAPTLCISTRTIATASISPCLLQTTMCRFGKAG